MPMYDFRCGSCGTEFEELVRGKEGENDVRCPDCDSRDIRREISAPCVHTGTGRASSGGSASGGCSPSSPFT